MIEDEGEEDLRKEMLFWFSKTRDAIGELVYPRKNAAQLRADLERLYGLVIKLVTIFAEKIEAEEEAKHANTDTDKQA